ncbi:MAG: ABC transporter ATP-binding protein [Proteobacteria bacterium]|nr:ABC transporter ATP-binding protein [Pseudomonadota bacterium]
MARAATHTLSLRDVSKHYGSLAAVDNVSLEVAGCEFLTLLWPSGSGKTTLHIIIAGFVEPNAGDVVVDNQTITHLPPEKRNFGMVFQGYALFPHLSVADNIAFPLKVRGKPRAEIDERVKAALELVQLGRLAQRTPKQLSGGQQQRVALARALVFTPHLLLLDEPLSALDKKLRAELQWELKLLHQQVGTTFIYVTHDQEEALSMSDRIAILRDGKVVQLGPPQALYERPASRFVADFLGKSNFISGTVSGAEADGFVYEAGGARFRQQGGAPAAGARVLVALRPEKIAISTRPANGGANAVAGEIVTWSYVGANFHFRVRTASLGDAMVTTPTWQSEVSPEAGRKVWLKWEPAASVIVADD